jgi:hypothetical protein
VRRGAHPKAIEPTIAALLILPVEKLVVEEEQVRVVKYDVAGRAAGYPFDHL